MATFSKRPIIATDPRKEKQVCFFCWRRFPYQSALRDHLKTHVVDGRECFCYECNPLEAVPHVEEIYSRYLHVQPKDIDRTSTTYLNRLHHCRLKSFENPVYTCDKCGCAFNGLAVFTKHMQNHALHRDREAVKHSARRSLFYCPKCQLPYRAVVPYIKHLKKHLIAIIRFNGIKERGTDYDFKGESYDNTGSLQCPVTECRRIFLKESEMISHMEEHLSKLSDAEVKKASEDIFPARGRPSLLSKELDSLRGGGGGGGGEDDDDDDDAIVSMEERLVKHLTGHGDLGDSGGEEQIDDFAVAAAIDSATNAEDHDDDAAAGGERNVGGDSGVEFASRNPLECDQCQRWFATPSLTLKHQHEEHMAVVTSCSLCWRRMGNTLELIDHVALTHDYTLTTLKRTALKRKYDSAAKDDLEFKCDLCRVEFADYKELLKHQHYVHGTADKKCRLCSKVINSYPSLMGHVNACDGSLQV